MGQSAGPGSPSFFMCHACRRERGSGREHENVCPSKGNAWRVKLTGKSRRRLSNYGSACGTRNTNRSLQYTCLDCDYTGWSTHIELVHVHKPPGCPRCGSETTETGLPGSRYKVCSSEACPWMERWAEEEPLTIEGTES